MIQPNVRIGNDVILWSGNHIGHDSTIEDHCFIASHAVISGNVTIGEPYCFVGVNATFRDGVTVAPRVRDRRRRADHEGHDRGRRLLGARHRADREEELGAATSDSALARSAVSSSPLATAGPGRARTRGPVRRPRWRRRLGSTSRRGTPQGRSVDRSRAARPRRAATARPGTPSDRCSSPARSAPSTTAARWRPASSTHDGRQVPLLHRLDPRRDGSLLHVRRVRHQRGRRADVRAGLAGAGPRARRPSTRSSPRRPGSSSRTARWRMWYVSGTGWDATETGPQHHYHVKLRGVRRRRRVAPRRPRLHRLRATRRVRDRPAVRRPRRRRLPDVVSRARRRRTGSATPSRRTASLDAEGRRGRHRRLRRAAGTRR